MTALTLPRLLSASLWSATPVKAQRKPVGLAIAVLLGCFGPAAHAQSLQALYTQARGFDAAYLATRAQTASAEFRTAQSYALKRPSASLNASAARINTDPPASATNPAGMVINTTSLATTLNARHPLFNRASDATIEQADKALEIAQTDLAIAEQDLIVRLAQAYFDVLAAQDVLTAAQASKKAIAEQLASAKRNFEVGTATITDQREAQARFDLVTAQEIAAENDLRIKRLALSQLVGLPDVKPQRLALPVTISPVTPNAMETWVAQAEGQHPAVRRAGLANDVAKIETRKARAGHLPTVDLVGSLGPSRSTNKSNNALINGSGGTTNTATVGVQMALPLYAGHAIENRVKEALALEEKAANDWANVRRTLAQSARAAFLSVQSGQAQVSALEAAESSSRLALEATQTGYRVGVRVNLDVLNAQTQLFQTQRDLAVARYNVLLGQLRLKQTTGALTDQDLATLDRLMVGSPTRP